MTLLGQVAVAAFLTLVTIAIHGACTAAILKSLSVLHIGHWVMRSQARMVAAIAMLVVVMLGASIVEASVWAVAYLLAGAIDSAETALYFSIVTFTTLGYGEIVLNEGWRVLASLQAATGIVVFGWTTALVIATVQRIAGLAGASTP